MKIKDADIEYWYQKVICQRAIHKELGVTSNDVRNWRKSLAAGKVTKGHMLYVLNLAGALTLGLPEVGEV